MKQLDYQKYHLRLSLLFLTVLIPFSLQAFAEAITAGEGYKLIASVKSPHVDVPSLKNYIITDAQVDVIASSEVYAEKNAKESKKVAQKSKKVAQAPPDLKHDKKVAELQQRLLETQKAKKELYDYRDQWESISNVIDQQRAKGGDTTNLKRNLDKTSEQITIARDAYKSLTKEYGSIKMIQNKLAKLK